VLEVRRERSGDQGAQLGVHVAARDRSELETAQPFNELVHQRNQQLTLRFVMLVEAANSESRASCDCVDRRAVVAALAKQRQRGCLESISLGQTAALARFGRQSLAGQ